MPKASLEEVIDELRGQLSETKVGNPESRGVKVGPVTTATQHESVVEGIERLRQVCSVVYERGGRDGLVDIEDDKGYFVGPVLFLAERSDEPVVHEEEVFGPVATVIPYDGTAGMAACLVAQGRGGLVTSVFSNDVAFCADMLQYSAPWSGRLYFGSDRVAEHATGHGAVLPQLQHGGPGRAGGGSELGSLRGLSFYMQKTAIQGAKPMLEKLLGA